MTITLIFLAGLMGLVVWWLVKQTTNVRPWIAQESPAEDAYAGVLAQPKAKTGLWVFLAVITSVFCLFISAYAMRMKFGDWRPLPEPNLLWLNTAVLVLGSVALQWARLAARQGRINSVRFGLHAAGILTLAFLAGQLLAWHQLHELGYFMASNPAYAFFYLITGLHGLHLLGGMVALGRTTARVWRGSDATQVRLSVELCAIYWHFLLIVWLVVFGLMLST